MPPAATQPASTTPASTPSAAARPSAPPAAKPTPGASAGPDASRGPAAATSFTSEIPGAGSLQGDALRDGFLAEVKRTATKLVYNTLIVPARRVEVGDGLVTFVFNTRPAIMQTQFEQQRPTLETIATTLAGRPMRVTTVEERDAAPAANKSAAANGPQDRLKESVMKEPAVQAMLDVFPAEIKDVEEM